MQRSSKLWKSKRPSETKESQGKKRYYVVWIVAKLSFGCSLLGKTITRFLASFLVFLTIAQTSSLHNMNSARCKFFRPLHSNKGCKCIKKMAIKSYSITWTSPESISRGKDNIFYIDSNLCPACRTSRTHYLNSILWQLATNFSSRLLRIAYKFSLPPKQAIYP